MRASSAGTITITLMLTATFVKAAEYRLPGGRATSMGGAGTAASQGAWSTYYNPAALADRENIRPRAGVAVHAMVRDRGVITAADRLSDYDWDDVISNPEATSADATAVADILRDIADDAAVLVEGGGALYIQIGSFGAGVLFDAQAGLIPSIDRQRLNITPPSDPNSLANNNSEVRVRALLMTEVPLAYGYRFRTDYGDVQVGGALKFMNAITYDGRITVTEMDADDLEDRLNSYDKESATFGVDLGLLYRAKQLPLRCGLLARNINSPQFDTWDGGSIKDDMQLRAGAEMALVGNWLVAAVDGDLTENETVIPGYKSRMIGFGLGLEGYPMIFAGSLRLGVMKNVAESDSGTIFTAGLGFGLKWFNLSINGAVSNKETTFDDETFPTEARLALALDSAW